MTRISLAAAAIVLCATLPFFALAEETPSKTKPPEESMAMDMPMGGMMHLPEPGLHLYGWLEAGITANFDSPEDNQNFGRLLDDRANEPLLNQFVLTAERGYEAMTDHFDWAFKLQFLYGSDARYLHTTGLFDLVTNDHGTS